MLLEAAIERLLTAGVPQANLCSVEPHEFLPLCASRIRSLSEIEEKSELTKNLIGTIVCVFFVALAAGLFLGYMTLDEMDLRIIQRSSIDEDERVYASKLIPIVQQRHRLLVTLLMFNTIAYEALPIFMDALVPSAFAVVFSTLIIMVFGEIIPSAFFTGPQQLYLANVVAPLVSFLMTVLYPAVYPLARVLDILTHEKTDPTTAEEYNRGELSALIRIQYEKRTHAFRGRSTQVFRQREKFKYDPTNDGPTWKALKREILEAALERDSDMRSMHDDEMTTGSAPPALEEQLEPPMHITEVKVMEGALQMRTRIALDVYTPLSKLYAIPEDLILTKETIFNIYNAGFSRVPVYRPNPLDPEDNTLILGFLMTRTLMMIDWEHERAVSTLNAALLQPDCISPRTSLVELLQTLREGGSLMAFVCARPDIASDALADGRPLPVEAGFMGVITMQDVFEFIIQDPVYDELDYKERERAVSTLQRWAATRLQKVFRRKQAQRLLQQARIEARRHSGSEHESASQDTDRTPLLGSTRSKERRVYFSVDDDVV